MKIIQPFVELYPQEDYTLEGIYKQIEKCARISYKSESLMKGGSSKEFVDRLIKAGHCFTGESSVLTEKGWVLWKEYSGEKIAVVNSDLSFKGYEIPRYIHKYDYSGNFYEYPSLGIKVTEGHTLFGLLKDKGVNFYNSENYYKFKCNTPYIDNNGRHKTLGERFCKIPRGCSIPTHTDPFYELVGFWLGDGCINDCRNKLTFHLKKERKIQYLKSLCDALNYSFTIGKNNKYHIESPNIGFLFTECYSKDKIKFIDNNKVYTPVQIHSIIQGLINSDGSKRKSSKTVDFCSSSQYIIDWIVNHAVIGGYIISKIKKQKRANFKHTQAYKISFLYQRFLLTNDSRRIETRCIITSETLKVYCVTTSTGLIIVKGINDEIFICGNCAPLEFGTVYLEIATRDSNYSKYKDNIYSHVQKNLVKQIIPTNPIQILSSTPWAFITTNFRVLVENGWLDDLKYLCAPTEYHPKRYCVKFTTDIGTAREFTRHKIFCVA